MTKNQKKEIECLTYFIPRVYRHVSISDRDIEKYFEWSERGKHKDELLGMVRYPSGFIALAEAKRWRGIHIHELWEPGVLDGTTPYFVILGKEQGEEIMPKSVVDFIKNEIFKGADSKLIEEIYNK